MLMWRKKINKLQILLGSDKGYQRKIRWFFRWSDKKHFEKESTLLTQD